MVSNIFLSIFQFEIVNYLVPDAEKIFGYARDEAMGHHAIDLIVPDNMKTHVNDIWAALIDNKGGSRSTNENVTKDGHTIICEWYNTPLVIEEGRVIGVTSLVDDITQHKQAERSLRRSEKMSALGKLTGGIAHDYNNMLAIILGYSNLLKSALGQDPKLLSYAKSIDDAARRSAKLTKKLLAFSQKKSSNPYVMNINSLFKKQKDLLEKSLTVNIKIRFNLDESLWMTYLDSDDLENAIVNMFVNAQHAMPMGAR